MRSSRPQANNRQWPNSANIGFSLVELAVTVLIIALIALLLMYGQSTLRNATLRRVMNEIEEYNQQIILFRNQYVSYPGDLPNASAIWVTQCDATPANCNGNGDGYIDFSTANLLKNESWRAWQHLKLAGINNDNLSGVGTSATSVIKYNVPASSMRSNLGWEINTYTATSQKYSTLDLYYMSSGIKQGISCTDIYLIDTKIDDGLPRRGAILVANTSPSANCYSTANSLSQYVITNSNQNGALQKVIIPGILNPNYE